MTRKAAIPCSFTEAAQMAQVRLAPDYMARIAAVSASYVYQWGDPDSDKEPTISRALRIDRECRATDGSTPFLRAYMAQLAGVPSGANAPSVTSSMLGVTVGIGHLASAVQEALCPNGPGGEAMTPTERAAISRAIDAAETSLHQIRGAIGDA